MTRKQLQAIIEDPKAFLERGKKLNVYIDERIEGKKERIQEWRRLAESVTAEIKEDVGSGGGGPSKLVETAVCNIVVLEQEIQEEIEALSTARYEAKTAIEMFVQNITQKDVLELRYLNDLPWSEIAERLHFAERWVYRLHRAGLDAVQQGALSTSH